MKPNRILRALKFVLFATLALGVFSFVVMNLWNWLMPALFGWHLIGFWQAGGHLGPEQDPVRRLPTALRSRLALAPPHDGTLGTDDPGGTREVPRRHARALGAMPPLCTRTESLTVRAIENLRGFNRKRSPLDYSNLLN